MRRQVLLYSTVQALFIVSYRIGFTYECILTTPLAKRQNNTVLGLFDPIAAMDANSIVHKSSINRKCSPPCSQFDYRPAD